MIQRIQSIWLLLAALCLGGLFLAHREAVVITPIGEMGLDHGSAIDFLNSWGAMSLGGLAAFLAVASIFLFKNRSLQMRLTRLALFDALLMMIVAGIQFFGASERVNPRDVRIGWAVGLPVLAVVFFWLARAAIRKDENLVKSMDRLR